MTGSNINASHTNLIWLLSIYIVYSGGLVSLLVTSYVPFINNDRKKCLVLFNVNIFM